MFSSSIIPVTTCTINSLIMCRARRQGNVLLEDILSFHGLFIEWKSDHFRSRYGQKRGVFLYPGVPRKIGDTFIGEFMILWHASQLHFPERDKYAICTGCHRANVWNTTIFHLGVDHLIWLAGGKTGNDFSPEKGLWNFFSIFSHTPANGYPLKKHICAVWWDGFPLSLKFLICTSIFATAYAEQGWFSLGEKLIGYKFKRESDIFLLYSFLKRFKN